MTRGRFFLYAGWIMFVLQAAARNPTPLTNVWIKAGGGIWADASAWSGGQLPSATQWVGITNPGPRTVVIDSAVAQNAFPSLSMFNLTVSNTNTLILDHVGSTLRIDVGTNSFWNGLEVSRGSTLLDLGSDIYVKGLLRVANGEFVQDGGVVDVPMTTYIHGTGVYRLTNGLVKAAYFELPDSGIVHQYGGTVQVGGELRVLQFSHYYLHDGEIVNNGDPVLIQNWATFTQTAGKVHTSSTAVFGASGQAAYLMDGGELYTSNVTVFAGMEEGTFEQNAGLVVVTNAIELHGSGRYYPPRPIEAQYTVGSNAVLRADSLLFSEKGGFSVFQTAGNVAFAGDITVTDPTDYPGELIILGGTLSCANVVNDGGVLDISQGGGSLVVSNVFSISGYYPGFYNGIQARPARYTLGDGTLNAKRIELSADWIIQSSSWVARIDNPGEFLFSGTLRVGDAQETLGRMILAGDATIDLGDGNAKIGFAASLGQAWTASALLMITNWNGLASGGGNDQIKFGNSNSGITSQQLSQIRFVNPNGFPDGEYAAGILDTGEVVPTVSPQMSVSSNSGSLVINWSNGGTLQSSANVEGPYTDLPSANPPYVVDVTVGSQLFLRLRP